MPQLCALCPVGHASCVLCVHLGSTVCPHLAHTYKWGQGCTDTDTCCTTWVFVIRQDTTHMVMDHPLGLEELCDKPTQWHCAGHKKQAVWQQGVMAWLLCRCNIVDCMNERCAQ